MPRKIASVKNANPSSEKGMPMIGPAYAMNPGQSSPSSNDSTVPETAPTANRIAVPFAHRLARSSATGSRVRCHRRSASTMSAGMPIPTTAKMMWKASDMAICDRAASRSDMRQVKRELLLSALGSRLSATAGCGMRDADAWHEAAESREPRAPQRPLVSCLSPRGPIFPAMPVESPDALLEALRAALAPEYDVVRQLGAGGMGSVFLARDATLDRPVAVKVISPELSASKTFRDRFLQEARTVAKLRHPNIVAVYAAGESAGLLYFVMEYVEGESLRDLLDREGRCEPERARRILRA